MKIAVFTSNQPRHFSLIRAISKIGDVAATVECSTLLPGLVPDYYRASKVMAEYFSHVIAAEKKVFGEIEFPPPNVRLLPFFLGDLSSVPLSVLEPVLDADVHIVFGSTYIRGPLAEFLVAKRAVNIHMGVSPYYRGSSCNFWALHDGRPDHVGATIHLLTKGLDSGPILFHALPAVKPWEPFELGMRAVEAAHQAVCARISDGTLHASTPVPQDRAREVRYTRGADFTDEIAARYLQNPPKPEAIARALAARQASEFIDPWSPA